jgi:hypothetical protein
VEEALTHYRAIGYREGEASALQATGRLLLDRSAPGAARQAFGSALELCLRLGHRGGIAASLEGLAQAFLASGEDAQDAVFCGAAAAQRDLLGALARTTQRRALAEIQSRLLASLGADQLQRATAGEPKALSRISSPSSLKPPVTPAMDPASTDRLCGGPAVPAVPSARRDPC